MFLIAIEVALQFDINISMSEYIYESFNFAYSLIESSTRKSGRQRAFIPASKTDQAFRVFLDLGECRGAFSLHAFPQLVSGDQAA